MRCTQHNKSLKTKAYLYISPISPKDPKGEGLKELGTAYKRVYNAIRIKTDIEFDNFAVRTCY